MSEPHGLPVPGYRPHLTPGIVHFGVGAFHRSHQAAYLHSLFASGDVLTWGVIGVGTTEADRRLHEGLVDQDGLYTLEVRRPDGGSDVTVIGSLLRHLLLPDDAPDVLAALAAPQIRIVTLTVTEGGYPVDLETGVFEPPVELDPLSTFELLVTALDHRRATGLNGLTIVSCDNIPENGRVARTAVLGHARLRDADLAAWIEERVTFPSSMVDRITPKITPEDVARIRRITGYPDAWPVVCEPYLQWVLEDRFVAGRPPLEQVGVQMVNDVTPYEKLKLRVLNGSHQTLAWLGLLLGHATVSAAMTDPDVAAFVRHYVAAEAIPTLDPVVGVEPANYAEQVRDRFAHPAIGDTLERLATDGSHRMPTWILAGARERAHRGESVALAATIVACWWHALRRAAGADARFEVVDPPLVDLIRSGGLDLDGFLRLESVFGTLAEVPAFTDAVRSTNERLEREPLREVLRDVLADSTTVRP